MSVLDFLPPHLADLSISDREIVLPINAALEAIDHLENTGKSILGWEGWIKTPDGHIGHGDAPQGTVSLEELTIAEAAELCRKTIREEARDWRKHSRTQVESLYFCITVGG